GWRGRDDLRLHLERSCPTSCLLSAKEQLNPSASQGTALPVTWPYPCRLALGFSCFFAVLSDSHHSITSSARASRVAGTVRGSTNRSGFGCRAHRHVARRGDGYLRPGPQRSAQSLRCLRQ